MNYREIEVEDMDIITKHIIIERDDGSFVSFPADSDNPNYIEFLKEINNK